jgi:hypothetical protein
MEHADVPAMTFGHFMNCRHRSLVFLYIDASQVHRRQCARQCIECPHRALGCDPAVLCELDVPDQILRF